MSDPPPTHRPTSGHRGDPELRHPPPGTDAPVIIVARRFRGPATSGNGGYTAGLLASHVPGAVEFGAAVTVRLRSPPPLDTPLSVETGANGTALARLGDTVVAEARLASFELEPVPPVPYELAVFAASRYAGLRKHPFPECVVCGPHRAPGDGLRLFPGRTLPRQTAAAWRPEQSLADGAGAMPPEIVWAALDCPGGWAADLEGRPMVLGTMTARIDGTPAVGEHCVVTGQLRQTGGRQSETATSLYGHDGRLLASARATWVEIDPEAFNRFFAPA